MPGAATFFVVSQDQVVVQVARLVVGAELTGAGVAVDRHSRAPSPVEAAGAAVIAILPPGREGPAATRTALTAAYGRFPGGCSGVGHVHEPRVVELRGDGHAGCRPEPVLLDDQVDLTGARRFRFARVRPLDLDHDRRVVLDRP